MCWTSRDEIHKSKISKGVDKLGIRKIAEEDIVVYKVGYYMNKDEDGTEKFMSYTHQDYHYKANEESKEIKLKFKRRQPDIWNDYRRFEVEEGYHSFQSNSGCELEEGNCRIDCVNLFLQEDNREYPMTIGEFIINKGSTYALGTFNTIVSSNLKWTGRYILVINLFPLSLSFKDLFEKATGIVNCNEYKLNKF